MLGNEVSIGQAAMVCLISMLVIFAVLYLISVMIDILAFSLKRKKGSNQPPAPATPMAAPVAARDSDTDIAVITAAAAAYLGRGMDEIIVREIRKVQNNESEWSRSSRTEALHND